MTTSHQGGVGEDIIFNDLIKRLKTFTGILTLYHFRGLTLFQIPKDPRIYVSCPFQVFAKDEMPQDAIPIREVEIDRGCIISSNLLQKLISIT